MSDEPQLLVLELRERELLRRAALRAAPREACGVLLGLRRGRRLEVAEVRELENRSEEAAGFLLDPVGLRAALVEAESVGREVLGAWHSHPSGRLQLSSRDRLGTPRGWCQVVLAAGRDARVGAWWNGPAGMSRLDLQEGV